MKEVQNAMNNVWNQIAPDLFDATGEDEMSRAEVIEMVLDADRVLTLGNLSTEAEAYFKALSYDERTALAEKTFTYDVYCG